MKNSGEVVEVSSEVEKNAADLGGIARDLGEKAKDVGAAVISGIKDALDGSEPSDADFESVVEEAEAAAEAPEEDAKPEE